MEKRSANYLFLATLVIGLLYQTLPYMNLPEIALTIIGTVWNLFLAFIAGYYFAKRDFLMQFKHFSFKALIWGIPLVLITGLFFSFLYSAIFGQATTNSVGETITLQMIVAQVLFMLMGEEMLSTNILIALQKRGLSFLWATVICSVLFALWHIPAYGFHPIQLLVTLAPARLALNYVWKKSSSIWVSWICHFIYDAIGFIVFFTK
jgi:membrane protease YdiL (CAAX protease family)